MSSSPAPTPSQAFDCPRCTVQLPEPDLVKHLWTAHRLLVDEGQVRDPWDMIDEWVQQYCLDGRPELLERCQALAVRTDPQLGLLRVQRFFIKHGVGNGQPREKLLAEARQRQASVCPNCFALAPARNEPPVRPLAVSHGRLSAGGYRVEVFEHRLNSWLEMETPEGLVYAGHEPGRVWNRHGALVLLAGPPVLLALLVAIVLPLMGLPPVPLVAALLVVALVGGVGVRRWWPDPGPAIERAVDYAWRLFVPHLHEHDFRMKDSAYLASLALTSVARHGRPALRDEILQRLLVDTKKAVAAGAGSVVHLAALWRLAVADAAALGGDPVAIVVTQINHYFTMKLPLAFAEHLLAGCLEDPWLASRTERLRILLLDRAFEAGLEVRDLTAIGQASPALGKVLRATDTDGLARLRLLWSMRPRQPWKRCGEAVTVFELAATPRNTARLQRLPNLLLEATDSPEVILDRFLFYQNVAFTELPRQVEVRRKEGGGNELFVDGRILALPDHPGRLVVRFQRWCQFFFQEFLPAVPQVHEWQAPNAPPLTIQVAVRCPECRHALLTKAGELATEVDPVAFGLEADGG